MSERVSTEEALRRVDLIVPLLALDARRALVSRAYLRASNEPVLTALSGVKTHADDGHAQSQNAHRIMLSIELARLFDVGNKPIEKQDKASLPVLSHYLARDDVRNALIRRVTHVGRVPRVAASIESYLRRWQRTIGGNEQAALSKLRTFRDYEIAHSIFDKQPDYPTYSQLFRLCTLTVGLVYRAEIAINGDETDFVLNARVYREKATSYWTAFTVGVLAIDSAIKGAAQSGNNTP